MGGVVMEQWKGKLKYRAICPLCGKAFDSREGELLGGTLVCPDCFKDYGQYSVCRVYDCSNQDEDNKANTKELEKKQHPEFVPKNWTDCYKMPLHLDQFGMFAWDAEGNMALSGFNYKYDERGKFIPGEQERIKHIIDVINGDCPSDFNPGWKRSDIMSCAIDYNEEYQFLVRGWGHLIDCGGLNLPGDLAAKMQDEFIDYIINRLNGE